MEPAAPKLALALALAAAAVAFASGLHAALGQAARPDAPGPLPAKLSRTGLYLPGTTVVDPRNRLFVPQYPLWSDGASKRRWIRLPEGGAIDASDPDYWRF